MQPEAKVEIQPRTTGEILDDAGRLCLADAPLLLALSGLFLVPAAAALLLLLAQPLPPGSAWRYLLPAITAALLPLTGLGSGACQELFRRRAEGKTAGLGTCLTAALRHGLDHVAARGVVLILIVLSALLLMLPALAVWIVTLPVHAIVASGRSRLFGALGAALAETQRHVLKATVVTLTRLLLLLFVLINLHMLAHAGLWVAGQLGGVDTALLELFFSLSNPVYLVALVLLAWLLLAPYGEAVNYLLHVDAQARYEGLDLWYRVQRYFPAADRERAGVAGLLLLGLLLAASPACAAADDRLAVVREARREVQQITEEVRTVEPYPGSAGWAARLDTQAQRLNHAGRYLWFTRALEGFRQRQREGALQVLGDLDRRLALVEESMTLPREPGDEADRPRLSREEIKKRLPQSTTSVDPTDPMVQPPPERDKEPEPVRRDDEVVRVKKRGPGLVGPSSGGELGTVGWMLLAGLLLAVLVLAIVLFRRGRARGRSVAAPRTGELAPSLESILTEPGQSVDGLWRRAEELARGEQFLEAVRVLYLAVLAVLHRANLVRYERTHTNGEYVQQLRMSAAAPETLYQPFRRLVRLFEEKWYGERACAPEDYRACRTLAEEIRSSIPS